MPEGDTIAKLRAYLKPRLEGQVLVGGELRGRPRFRFTGLRIEAVEAHGKHLFLEFEGGVCLRSHLGMHGTWHRYGQQESWKKPREHASLWFATETEVYVLFHAMEVEVGDAGREATVRRRRLGVDLVREDPPPVEVLAARVRTLIDPGKPVVDLLLDQRIAAGIGNVYKSETLFLERVLPTKRVGELTLVELEGLYRRAKELLQRNLAGGPRVTHEGPGDRLWVYRREGLPCPRCGTAVLGQRMGRGQRSTYWCPECPEGDEGTRSSGTPSSGSPSPPDRGHPSSGSPGRRRDT